MIVHALTQQGEMRPVASKRGESPKRIRTVSAIVGKILVVRKSALPNARRLPEFRFKTPLRPTPNWQS
jgi:hypothetical protein